MRNYKARSYIAKATAGIATVALAVIAVPAVYAQGFSNSPDASFYTPPADLSAPEGTLIKSEPMPLALSLPAISVLPGSVGGNGNWPANGHRMMYRSTNSQGKPIAVTGTYLQPNAPWTGDGERPLAVIAPGTNGQGDNCAPSKSFQTLLNIDTEASSVGVGYEYIQAYMLLAEGFAVAITDYEGLGTPGVHTYADRVSSANSVLDAARAAKDVPGSDLVADYRTVLTGYSQGGGATGAAVELQPKYAPDLNVVGAAVGAPPADLLAVLKHIDGTGIVGAVGYAFNSLSAVSPFLTERLDGYLNDEGKAMLKTVAKQCIPETALQFGLHRTSEYTKSGKSAYELIRDDPEVLIEIEKQRIGKLKPNAPLRITTGINDDAVPTEQAQQLGRDWCAQEAIVEMHFDFTPPIAPGYILNHAIPLLAQLPPTVQYLSDRVAGVPAPNNCGTY